jgi:hypothetical protein
LVLKRTVDNPGVATDEFKAVRESLDTPTSAGLNVLQTSLHIRKGQFIGIADLSDQTYINDVDNSGIFGVFDPPLAPGDPGSTPDQFPVGAHYGMSLRRPLRRILYVALPAVLLVSAAAVSDENR